MSDFLSGVVERFFPSLVPTIRDARLFAGAGFVTAYCGDMLMMPGLPSHPSGEDVDINAAGETIGLF